MVERTIKIMETIASNIVGQAENFNLNLDGAKYQLDAIKEIHDSINLLTDDLVPELEEFEVDHEAQFAQHQNNQLFFEELQTELTDLEAQVADCTARLQEKNEAKAQLEAVFERRKLKIESLEKKKNNLGSIKLLTNTIFDQRSNMVSGFTIGLSGQVNQFNMNPSELSEKEITEKLWENLEFRRLATVSMAKKTLRKF